MLSKYVIRKETDWHGRYRYGDDTEWVNIGRKSDPVGIVSASSITDALLIARSLYGHHVIVTT